MLNSIFLMTNEYGGAIPDGTAPPMIIQYPG